MTARFKASLFPMILALVTAGVAFGAEPGPRLTRFPVGEVRSGETFELEWSQAPGDIEELEILLSVDGGRHYSLRVSPELEARTGHWLWRVPTVLTHHARLRVRYGRERDEALGEPTPEFGIRPREGNSEAPPQLADPEARMVHEPGWWSAEDSEPPLERRADLEPGGASISDRAPGSSLVPPRRQPLPAPTRTFAPAARTQQLSGAPAPPEPSTSPLRLVPLRE